MAPPSYEEQSEGEQPPKLEPWKPDFLLADDPRRVRSPMERLFDWTASLVSGPADWIRENVVLPNKGPKYYWYHRKFGRAVPIDECYIDDYACIYEADVEYRRNRKVDREILTILRERYEECLIWESGKHQYDYSAQCRDVFETYQKAEMNYYIKYGDLSWASNVVTAFMKQKHRMIFERRKAAAQEKAARECSPITQETG